MGGGWRVFVLACATALGLAVTPGCGCGTDDETGGSHGKPDAQVDGASGASGASGAGGSGGVAGADAGEDASDAGGDADAGDAGDAADATALGPSSSEFVSAGGISEGPNYKMLHTLGQPSQNQETSTSPGYKMQGGIVGATSP